MTSEALRSRPLVVIPTYNEAENIEPIVERTLTAVPEADVLIVDDNSPDGTGEIGDGLASLHREVHVLHRDRKEGFGFAYRAGFDWALEHDYQAVVEMDADGSHQPEQLPSLLKELTRADIAMGSRWIPGGRVENWPWRRVLLSRAGNFYARLVLGVWPHDLTGGFRAFRRDALQRLDHDALDSRGYCFQVDLAQRAADADLSVVEVPIVFREREHGDSKMSLAVVLESMWRITGWAVVRRWRLWQRRLMGLYSRFLMAFTRSKAMVPVVHHVVVPLDRRIFKATKGRMSLTHLGSSLKRHAMQDLLLTTTGAKSGKQRSTPVLFLDHDGGYVVVGSRYGTESHPHWTANLLAHPEATVLVRGVEQKVAARRLRPAELDALWSRLLEIYPNWADYRERTDREFRAFHLTPV